MKRLSGLLLAGVLLLPQIATAYTVINWDAYPGSGSQIFLEGRMEQDFFFNTPDGVVLRNSGYSAGYPDNGTSYLQATSTQQPMDITQIRGVLFSLYSVDLAEYSTVYAMTYNITFTGHCNDGGTVSQTFQLDGIVDGTGPLVDFQTFYFSPDFHDLLGVTIEDPRFSMDNLQIQVGAIPEPAVGTLLATGMAGFIGFARKRIRLPARTTVNS